MRLCDWVKASLSDPVTRTGSKLCLVTGSLSEALTQSQGLFFFSKGNTKGEDKGKANIKGNVSEKNKRKIVFSRFFAFKNKTKFC